MFSYLRFPLILHMVCIVVNPTAKSDIFPLITLITQDPWRYNLASRTDVIERAGLN